MCRRRAEKATRGLKPAPWGGFGYTRTRGYQAPGPPRNQNPKGDSGKALEAAFFKDGDPFGGTRLALSCVVLAEIVGAGSGAEP
jgi:hypothetical protein